jgi:N-acetyl-anhydromuramyl-L-alanine amidase AmpD
MANHLSRYIGVGAGALVGLMLAAGGCQQQPATVEQLPAANFNGPLVVAPAPAPVETPKVAPKPPSPPVDNRPKASPPLVGIPRDWTPGARANDWRWIVLHHSATPAGGAKTFDKMHKQKGWDELGYHFVIGNGTDTADGQVEVGPRWTKQKHGAHAKTPDNQFNMHGIGICLVGNFDNERPTRAQLAALNRLVAFLMKTYHVSPGKVLGHEATGRATECPGKFLDVASVRRAAGQMAGVEAAQPMAQTAGVEMLRGR